MATEGAPVRPIVSVSYDGTQLCHAESVLPHLDAFGLKGTFYADPLPLLESLPVWRKAAEHGHEIGNGCLIGSVDNGGAMDAWTPEMVGDDIDETDAMLQELFPTQSVFSFGYPWVTAGAVGLAPLRRIVEERHSVCRSGQEGTNPPDGTDLAYLKCVPMDGYAATEMIDIVRMAIRQRHWIILAFDGVGSGDPSVDASAHRDLCEWLSESAELLTVSTVSSAAETAQGAAKTKLRLL